jgi:hypothetical protein
LLIPSETSYIIPTISWINVQLSRKTGRGNERGREESAFSSRTRAEREEFMMNEKPFLN